MSKTDWYKGAGSMLFLFGGIGSILTLMKIDGTFLFLMMFFIFLVYWYGGYMDYPWQKERKKK